jgi:hypothetical protein
VIVPAVYAADPAGPTIGAGMFGGILVVILASDGVVSASNDLVGTHLHRLIGRCSGVTGFKAGEFAACWLAADAALRSP